MERKIAGAVFSPVAKKKLSISTPRRMDGFAVPEPDFFDESDMPEDPFEDSLRSTVASAEESIRWATEWVTSSLMRGESTTPPTYQASIGQVAGEWINYYTRMRNIFYPDDPLVAETPSTESSIEYLVAQHSRYERGRRILQPWEYFNVGAGETEGTTA